ncbi:MAG: SdpI family protein [Candidatus Sumerlaeia bacterium]
MSAINQIIAIANISVGLIIILASVPLFLGRVGRNRWYGIRTRKALASEENWYRINRYAARRMIIWSVLIILSGPAALLVDFGVQEDPRIGLIILFAHIPLILLIPVIETVIWSRKL